MSVETGRESWHPARLIPTAGIKGQEEQERRATSSLLAVMRAVPEFGHALLRELGAPKSPTIDTYTEVRFKDGNGRTVIPDGAIVCERGKKVWTCLVEVKTGRADLRDEQVGGYLDVARANGFDGVLTISNQITAASTESPVAVDRRRLGKRGLWHFSWWRIITEAIVQSRYRGVSDPDQAWILGELLAYLDSEASGAAGFEDMGDKWVAVRGAAHEGTLRTGTPEVREVAARWEEFTQYLGLGLTQDLGRTVTALQPRAHSSSQAVDGHAKRLVEEGALETVLRVPDAAGDVTIRVDLRARRTLTSVTVAAPREGRVRSRVNWLLRQLADAPDDLRVDVSYPNARQTVGCQLAEARENLDCLRYAQDPKREPRSFTLTLGRPMGLKRGKVDGSFVRETRRQTFDFYRDLVQTIRPWQPPAPKLREEPTSNQVPDTPQADPPPFASDGRDPGDAIDPWASTSPGTNS